MMAYYREEAPILDWKDASPCLHRGEKGRYVIVRHTSGFSNFKYLFGPAFNSHRPLHRIFSLARLAGSSRMMIERIQLRSTDIKDVDTVRTFELGIDGQDALRVSFLKRIDSVDPEEIPNTDNVPIDVTQYSMIGYVVFFRGAGNYEEGPCVGLPRAGQIYESVLSPSWTMPDVGPFIHCSRRYMISTAAGSFNVKGVLYTQQNGHTTHCLHAAMRMALSSVLPGGDIEYQTILEALEKCFPPNDGGEKKLFNSKYTVDELVEVINNLGQINCVSLLWESNSKLFDRTLYELVEAGAPAILGYETSATSEGHAVTVIGHTFDNHNWTPLASQLYFPRDGVLQKCASSEDYVNAFVLHDDNCGPYLTLPKNFFVQQQFADNMPPFLLGFTKRSRALNGNVAEKLAYCSLEILLKKFSTSHEISGERSWLTLLYRHFKHDRLVLRSIKIPYDQYLAHLENDVLLEEKCLEKITNHILKQSLWMVEISCHELFGITRKKFGEMLLLDKDIRGTSELKLGNVFYMARLPQLLFTDLSGKPCCETNVDSSTPLFDFGQYR